MSLSTCQTSGVEPTQLESYMYWEKKKKEEKKKRNLAAGGWQTLLLEKSEVILRGAEIS